MISCDYIRIDRNEFDLDDDSIKNDLISIWFVLINSVLIHVIFKWKERKQTTLLFNRIIVYSVILIDGNWDIRYMIIKKPTLLKSSNKQTGIITYLTDIKSEKKAIDYKK